MCQNTETLLINKSKLAFYEITSHIEMTFYISQCTFIYIDCLVLYIISLICLWMSIVRSNHQYSEPNHWLNFFSINYILVNQKIDVSYTLYTI